MYDHLLDIVRSTADAFDYKPRRKNRSRYTRLRDSGPIRRTLIHGCPYLITVDEHDRLQVRRDVSILIEGGMIKDIVPAQHYRRDTIPDVDLLYDAEQRGGLVITPGFVNGHTHPPMYLLRSSLMVERETADFEEALRGMASLEQQMNDEDFYVGSVGDFTEQLKSGVTSLVSHYGVFEPIDQAARDTRMRAINAISLASNSHPENTPALVKQLLKRRSHYDTELAVAIHYLFRATPKQLAGIAATVRKNKLRFTLHLGELQRFVDECIRVHGDRPIAVLDRYKLLGPQTIISHGILLNDDEIALIEKRKATVVHLPTSNLVHRRGQFPYTEFVQKKAHRQVVLGTDGVISKNRLDMLTEAFQAKVMHQSNTMIPYSDLFRMMTSQGADRLGFSKRGRVAVGYHADLAFWKLKDRGFIPYDRKNPKTLIGNMIAHGGRQVRDLMIDGQFVISNRTHNHINESALMQLLQEAHSKLRDRLKKAPKAKRPVRSRRSK